MAHASVELAIKTAPGLVQIMLGGIPFVLDANTAREVGEAIIDGADKAMDKLVEEIPNGE